MVVTRVHFIATLEAGVTVARFNLDGYSPVITEIFITSGSVRESTLLKDSNTRTGQEYKPCALLEGKSKISV